MVLAAVVAVTALKSNYISFTMERSSSPVLTEESAPRQKYGINAETEGSEEEGLLGGRKGGRGGGGRREEGSSEEEPSSGYGGSVVNSHSKPTVLEMMKKIAPE